jgi:hypothetical protein
MLLRRIRVALTAMPCVGDRSGASVANSARNWEAIVLVVDVIELNAVSPTKASEGRARDDYLRTLICILRVPRSGSW